MADPATAHPVKAAIVSDWLTVPGGAEETLRHVLPLVDGPIYAAQYNPARFPWLHDRDVRAHWISHLPLSKTRHWLYAPVLADAYRAMDLSRHDLVVAMSHTFAHNARPRPDAPMMAYYYTVARALWLPEIDARAGRGRGRAAVVRRLKRLDLEASRRPDHIVAISHTAAERVARFYGRRVDAVVYPPVETAKWADVPRASTRLGALVWGRLIDYKRFDLAVEAARLGGFPLQIVGAGPAEGKLKALAAGAKNVVFHGRLSDEDLKAIMAETQAVLFPGYEDFGIVPVEGMAAGLPVAAYGLGGAAETVADPAHGEGGGALFHEPTPQALADAYASVADRDWEPASLRARAERFSAERFAEGFAREMIRAKEKGRAPR